MNSQVEEILKKHIATVNSFLDENGHNRFIECVEELTQLITSREQEIREETIMKCMALVNTHTEHNGNYCDTGEDMGWACRSECVDMAEARLEKYLSQQKENK